VGEEGPVFFISCSLSFLGAFEAGRPRFRDVNEGRLFNLRLQGTPIPFRNVHLPEVHSPLPLPEVSLLGFSPDPCLLSPRAHSFALADFFFSVPASTLFFRRTWRKSWFPFLERFFPFCKVAFYFFLSCNISFSPRGSPP